MTELDRKRLVVLQLSLALEKVASTILGFIFDIDDVASSKCFGNQSTSLSFNQKMYLLLDYKVIEKNDKVKLDGIMNIRNQFLHNADCRSYQDAFSAIVGLENSFKKLYPELFQVEDKEICFESCIKIAFDDCIRILSTAKGGVKNKIEQNSERVTFKEILYDIANKASINFASFAGEVNNEQFNFKDKEILIQRILKLRTDIFGLGKDEDKKD